MTAAFRWVDDPAERSRSCGELLRGLPEWFGIAGPVERYAEEIAGLPTAVVDEDGAAVGLAALKRHTARSAEVFVLAVRADRRREAIGRRLLAALEAEARAGGVSLLQVKTLGPSRPGRGDEATRRFYEACGFEPLEELDGVWPDDPCLLLVKPLRPTLVPVEGLPEIEPGADLAALIAERAQLEDGDVLVVAQKAVSKAEGRVRRLAEIEPTNEARALAVADADPRHVQAILDETARVVRSRPPLVIAETRHGFVCASAGVDASNAPEPETVVLLPLDPDASAAALRARLRELTGRDVGVIVSDSFGRPFRQGTTDVAIGAAGITALRDLRGTRDASGYELRSTQVALADELAAAADLARGKASGVPAVVVRGLAVAGDGRAGDLVMPPERDLFR